MQSFIALGIITIQLVLYGYSLAFGPDIGHIIGPRLDWAEGGWARTKSRLLQRSRIRHL